MGRTVRGSRKRLAMKSKREIEKLFPPKLGFKKFLQASLAQVESSSSSITICYDQELGRGSYSRVYKGTSLVGEVLAVKVMDISRPSHVTYFNEEAKILSRLSHPAFIQLKNTFISGREGFLAMEYFEGEDLFTYVENSISLPEDESKSFFSQILEGVSYCHDHNIAHRDLKLENILVGTNRQLKIIDFGLSIQVLSRPYLTNEGVGSPLYMAPEILNHKTYDPFLADIWSLGVILYSIGAGHNPFRATSMDDLITEVNAQVIDYDNCLFSFGLRNLLRAILTLCPEDRLSISEMKQSSWLSSMELDF